MPRAMYFATVLRCRPVRLGDRRDGHPLLVQLQYHNQLRQPDHPSPPPTHRRRGGLRPDAVPTGRLSQHLARRRRIEMSVFQSPDLARIHPAISRTSSVSGDLVRFRFCARAAQRVTPAGGPTLTKCYAPPHSTVFAINALARSVIDTTVQYCLVTRLDKPVWPF